uniref:Serpin domain-containing protein n=1 Tax=Bos taurus TaxID=9913 RepID=E1BB19_BOVIN
MDSLSTANVEFCLDVFKELNYNHAGDNVFFSLLSLLYALSMILLGARGTSAEPMEKVEKQLNSKTFQEWTSPPNMVERDVEVHLLRFKLEIKYELNSLLESLGMTDIFSQVKADLSGISPVKGLFVSKIIHKSYVEVNKEGTEAAAATGDILVVKRLPIRAQFVVNHPFLFFIKHFHTNTILLCGKLASP